LEKGGSKTEVQRKHKGQSSVGPANGKDVRKKIQSIKGRTPEDSRRSGNRKIHGQPNPGSGEQRSPVGAGIRAIKTCRKKEKKGQKTGYD